MNAVRPKAVQVIAVAHADVAVQHADVVLIDLFCAITGYTRKAIEGKVRTGAWLKEREFTYSPDGHIQIIMKGYYQWVAKGRS
jgi:hypothetical protein